MALSTSPLVSPALGWSYDSRPGVNRYRNPQGQFVSAQQIVTLRNDFLTARSAITASLAAQVASGEISADQWESAMQAEIKTTLGVEYAFGRGGLTNMTPADWDALGALVADRYDYLADFAADIADGRLSEAQITARSDLYIGAGVGAYERGAASASDVDLPVYPGDDCLGLTNCRCSWQMSLAEDGSVEAYWIAEPDACEVCAGHADEFNPWTQDA